MFNQERTVGAIIWISFWVIIFVIAYIRYKIEKNK